MLRTLCALLAMFALTAAAAAQGSICAHGGGADWEDPSHKEMIRWMVERARRTPDEAPAAVILGAVPREPNEPDAAADAFRAGGASPQALVITADNADDPAIATAIETARIVWIRGGDQGRYVTGWKGRATERAIRKVFEAGGVVGGTSAGCAVLGEVTYDARNDSLRPEQALTDAHHPNLTLTDGFLNLVPGVLFDTHFTERGRIGRLPVMMARAKADFGKSVLGVGVDHGTALLIEPDGRATVIGSGAVAFLQFKDDAAIDVREGMPPLVRGIRYDRLGPGGVYNLRRFQLIELPARPSAVAIAGGRVRRTFADAWARDGGIAERVKHACGTLICSDDSLVVFLTGDAKTQTDADGTLWLRGPDEGKGPPTASLCMHLLLFRNLMEEGFPRMEERLGDRNIVQEVEAFRGAVLHVLPPGWGFRGDQLVLPAGVVPSPHDPLRTVPAVPHAPESADPR